MKKHVFYLIVIITIITVAYVLQVQAQNNITYPIAELGGCKNKTECKAYCDQIDHIQQCINFAEQHNLLSAQEIKEARKIAKVGTGPGGCTSKAACQAYCDNIQHINECLQFAEEHDIIPKSEIAEARKVAKAVNAGVKFPGGCTSKASCDAYCSVAAHMEECLNFAEAAGLISQKELKEAKKVLPFMLRGEMPGGCTAKASCDAYCAVTAHMEECLNFAEKAGFISKKEAAEARRMLPFMLSGQMPGGCTDKTSCDAYCKNPDHTDECIDFAVKAGLMNKTEAAMIKKMKGFMQQGGPGGCQSKEECEAYCSRPGHEQECQAFAEKYGLERPNGQMRKGGPGGCSSEEECHTYCSQPEHEDECRISSEQ